MKTKNAIIALVLLAILGVACVWIITASQQNHTALNVPENQMNTESSQGVMLTGTQCFYQEVPTQSGFNDKWTLRLVIAEDGTATGDLRIIPAEKDSSTGTLAGTVAPNADGYVADMQFNYMIEGTTGVDQRIFRVTSEGAYLGYGELYEAANGTYQYKDPANLSYVGPIPKVACDAIPQ